MWTKSREGKTLMKCGALTAALPVADQTSAADAEAATAMPARRVRPRTAPIPPALRAGRPDVPATAPLLVLVIPSAAPWARIAPPAAGSDPKGRTGTEAPVLVSRGRMLRPANREIEPRAWDSGESRMNFVCIRGASRNPAPSRYVRLVDCTFRAGCRSPDCDTPDDRPDPPRGRSRHARRGQRHAARAVP